MQFCTSLLGTVFITDSQATVISALHVGKCAKVHFIECKNQQYLFSLKELIHVIGVQALIHKRFGIRDKYYVICITFSMEFCICCCSFKYNGGFPRKTHQSVIIMQFNLEFVQKYLLVSVFCFR